MRLEEILETNYPDKYIFLENIILQVLPSETLSKTEECQTIFFDRAFTVNKTNGNTFECTIEQERENYYSTDGNEITYKDILELLKIVILSIFCFNQV